MRLRKMSPSAKSYQMNVYVQVYFWPDEASLVRCGQVFAYDISVCETKNTRISINIDGLKLTTRYISAHLHPRLRSIGQITIARRLPRRMRNITFSDTRSEYLSICENNEWTCECAFTASLVLIPKIIRTEQRCQWWLIGM